MGHIRSVILVFYICFRLHELFPYFREREKTGLATATGDPIPPLMGEPEVRGWDENQDYRMDTYSSRYKSNERFGRSPPPRSRSRY